MTERQDVDTAALDLANARREIDHLQRECADARDAWGAGECCSDCPHHGFTVTELDGRDPKELTWEETFALLHSRAETAEARIATALSMVDGCGSLAHIKAALNGDLT